MASTRGDQPEETSFADGLLRVGELGFDLRKPLRAKPKLIGSSG
jgi:hypothetical protein